MTITMNDKSLGVMDTASSAMNDTDSKFPRFPLYIVSKSRADTRLTSKSLEMMNVPYYIVVEEQEYDDYAAAISPDKILVLDKRYQAEYDTCDDLGDTKSKGPGPARNFVWDHSIKNGHTWHWVMDDNIRHFFRMNRNKKNVVTSGVFFRVMEDFCLRYENVAMAGPCYTMFVPRKSKHQPIILNTRIYSCNLIRNDMPYRWRGRYNEDTDLSLRMLKDRWCTVQFAGFQQQKIATQLIKGGNTKEFYDREGTQPKTDMLVRLHPDVTQAVWKFGRYHHIVDYGPFRRNRLIRKPEFAEVNGVDEYGMALRSRA